eukprot:GHVN01080413.1.p1 GENE.GHVN01080413.1~~GHVN01080413.1.p1  ORF type:complete len:198 (-),score=11.39 GHVN01080413.1:182-775(-)
MMPDPSRGYEIFTDASERAVGAVLTQVEGNGKRSYIHFASKKLSPQQQNWETREREADAIVFAIEKFEPYFAGAKVKIWTDHKNLTWLFQATTGRLYRWSARMLQYQPEIVYVKGKKNLLADWLSRSLDRDEEEDWEKAIPSEEDIIEAAKKEGIRDPVRWMEGVPRHVSGKLYIPAAYRKTLLFLFHASRTEVMWV